MKHKPNPLKNKQLVQAKVLRRVQRLEDRLPQTPVFDMDGSRFAGVVNLNSKDARIGRRLWDISSNNRHGFLLEV